MVSFDRGDIVVASLIMDPIDGAIGRQMNDDLGLVVRTWRK